MCSWAAQDTVSTTRGVAVSASGCLAALAVYLGMLALVLLSQEGRCQTQCKLLATQALLVCCTPQNNWWLDPLFRIRPAVSTSMLSASTGEALCRAA